MAIFLIILIALIEAAIAVGVIFFLSIRKKNLADRSVSALKDQLVERKRLFAEAESILANMIKIEMLALAIKQLRELQERLKSEQGRIAITQTELETVETRLRELEEIERELEASNIEIQEELSSLKEKENSLRAKNDKLKSEINDSVKHIEELMGEIELSAQVVEQVKLMKTQLLASEDKVEKLLVQIEEANSHYMELRRRYDALDIEYAQLYEKFSSLEEASS